MESLAAQLMEAFALALDLPPSWFTDKMAGHCSALRVLYVGSCRSSHRRDDAARLVAMVYLYLHTFAPLSWVWRSEATP